MLLLLLLTFHIGVKAGNKPLKDSVTLHPVVVDGLQNIKEVRFVPKSLTVVSREEIEKTNASSVLSSLKGKVPGLFITERGMTGFGIFSGAAGGISLRGVGGSPMTQVLIAIDGHPQSMGINGHHLPDAYIACNAESIEVIRGPASCIYGSNAMGGVINILTKEEKINGLRTSGSIQAGSFNTQKYMLSLGLKKNRLSGFLSANYDKTDGHRDHSAFNLFNTFAKVGYALSSHVKTSADFSLSDYHSTDPGPVTHLDPTGQLIKNMVVSDSLKADVTRGMLSLNLDNTYNNTNGKVKLYYDFGHHELYDGWKSDDINAGYMVNQSLTPWKGSIFTLGLDYKLYGGTATRTNNPNFHLDKTITETSLYLTSLQNLFSNKLTLDAGLRLENNSVFGNEWVPEIGLSFRPKELSVLKASIAKGFRSPTIRELYINAANADLKPERMVNYEIAFIQYSTDKKFRGEIAIYHSIGSNLIQTLVIANIPKYFNTGKFNNTGVELATQYAFPFRLTVSANYSYIHWEHPILATPQHQFNAGAEYSLGKFSIEANLQHLRNYYLKVDKYPVKENFTLLDFQFGYRISKNISIFCKADNLLNTSYQMSNYYPMPGITCMSGLKIVF